MPVPTLINGVSGGNLGSCGYTYVAGKYMFTTSDNVGGLGVQGSFSIFDISAVTLSSPPVLVGQIVDATLFYAEGLWVDPTLSYAVVCVLGGYPPSPTQIANASVKTIAIAACIAAYESHSSPSAPVVAHTLTNVSYLNSPENLLVITSGANTYGFVSNLYSTGTNDYTAIDLTTLTAPHVLISISNAALAGAVFATYLGATIYCSSRGGLSITQIDISTPSSMYVKGTPLNLSTSLTGIDVAQYPAIGKTFAFVAGTVYPHLFAVDVTNASAMTLIATITDPTSFNYPSNVKVIGSLLYSTAYGPVENPGSLSGITITNITDPTNPSVITFTSTTILGLASTVALDHFFQVGSLAYVSDTSVIGGAYIFQLNQPIVAAPSFTPSGGVYTSQQSVTIGSGTSGATIRFTTDGTVPSETHGTIYTGPVSVVESETIAAIAYLSGWSDSSISSAVYTISGGTPETVAASPQPTGVGSTTMIPLTNSPNQSVTVSLPINGGTVTLGLEIYYNENGEDGNFWAMDISDQYGNLLVASVPLVTGVWPAANILAPWDYLRIGAAFVINQSASSLDIPDDNTLGSQFALIWAPN